MKISVCTAKKLRSLAKKRGLVLFGAGNNLLQLFSSYGDLNLEKYVEYIVDNDKNRIGKQISINGIQMEIMAPQVLNKLDIKKYTIVITPNSYKGIFCQLQNLLNNANVKVYRMPETRNFAEIIWCAILKKLPLKNVIVLGGEGDTCENALALGKAIAANNYYNKYKLVWLCDHPDKFESSINELFLDRNTLKERNSILVRLKYYYWMCTAKYIIFENKRIKKFREDQMSVYLTHGAIDLKNIKTVVTLPEDLNYVVYPSDYIASRWAKEFSISMDRVILCGSPRTDILFQQCDNNDIIKFLKVDQFNKTIIWTPTFRKHVNGHRNDSKVDLPYGVPIIKGEQEWEILNEFLVKNNIQIILKPHRYQDMTCIKAMDSLNFRVISQQELDEKGLNVYDIMPYMDAMVSDYSSITFDFMLLDRPIGYTIDDMEDYKLGFAVDNIFDFMPGHKFKTIDEFIAFLIDVCEGADVYFNQRKKVLHGLNEFADGENANRLCEKLKLSK